MGRVTIYLDDETERKMVAKANVMKLSKSKWIANAIRQKMLDEWPDTVRKLPGSWDNFPSLDEIRAELSADTPSETL